MPGVSDYEPGDILLSPANYDAYAKAFGSAKQALDFDLPAPLPLDKVEFRRPVEVQPGVFVQVLRFGQAVRTPGGMDKAVEVFAWLDGGDVILSTGQTIPLSGGLVELYVPGE